MTMWFRGLAAVAVLVAILTAGTTGQTIAPLQPDRDTGRVTYFISPGEPKSEFRPSDTELATWALRAWEKAVEGTLKFVPASEAEALVQVHFVGPGGGQYR